MSVNTNCNYVCTWRVENLLCFHEGVLESPMFSVEGLDKCKWALGLCFSRKNLNSVACYLIRKVDNNTFSEITFGFTLEFLSCDGFVVHQEIIKRAEFQEEMSHGIDHFIAFNKLVDMLKNWREDTLTIRCSIVSCCDCDLCAQGSMGCELSTTVEVDHGSYTFDVVTAYFLRWTEDSIFASSDMSKFKVTLDATNPEVEVKITILDQVSLHRLIKFRVTFLNSKGDTIESKCDVYTFHSESTWKFPSFINNKKKMEVNNGCILYDFSVKCHISISKEIISPAQTENYISSSSDIAEVPSVSTVASKSKATPLQQSLRYLLNSKKYSDVTFKVMGEEIAAHKAILGSRSPVFAVMFDQDMLENTTGVVDIVDIDKEILKLFLEFMYTEAVEGINYETAIELIVVAEKYQVVPLKEECSKYLMFNMSLGNACDVLTTAHLINHEDLKLFAMNYVKNHASKILSTSEWQQWIKHNIELASEILSTLSVDVAAALKK